MEISAVGWIAIACIALSTIILVWFLVTRPEIVRSTKIALFFGIAVFPIAGAMAGNVSGYAVTKERRFCGSCHLMGPYIADSEDAGSRTLAAAHSRNELFGSENCYACHSDYGMFGTVTTKLSGMRHMYEYFTRFRNAPVPETLKEISLYKPFDNRSCMKCHSTQAPRWERPIDHKSISEDLRSGKVTCVGAGCHGPSHPFSKEAER